MTDQHLIILAATVSSFLLGGLWYSPMMFQQAWMNASGVPSKGRHPAKVFAGAACFSAGTAIAMKLLFPGRFPDAVEGAIFGALVGLGITFTTFGMNSVFSGRSWKLILIDGGYHIAQLALMGAIYGFGQS